MSELEIDLNEEFAEFLRDQQNKAVFDKSSLIAMRSLESGNGFFMQKEKGGERILLPTRAPGFITGVQYERLVDYADKVRVEISTFVERALHTPNDRSFLEIDPRILALFEIDPGYDRFDLANLYTRGDWLGAPDSPKHCEENAECPAGEGYNLAVNRAWIDTEVIKR